MGVLDYGKGRTDGWMDGWTAGVCILRSDKYSYVYCTVVRSHISLVSKHQRIKCSSLANVTSYLSRFCFNFHTKIDDLKAQVPVRLLCKE